MALKVIVDLNTLNEGSWFHLGQIAESLNEPERAIWCYDAALRYDPVSEKILLSIASLCRSLEKYPLAAEYFQRILKSNDKNGEVWGALGHCYLMMDELQHAYSAYQQAVHFLPNTKEPKLWYGIGILYDRFGSLEHAEEAFSAVLRMNPDFERANDVYFRLGIIYKNQKRFDRSLECFRNILRKPPAPLTEADIWFQIALLYEQNQDFKLALETYERVLYQNPSHAKALQHLGWLFQRPPFSNLEASASTLLKAVELNSRDGYTWYLLGRCYMVQKKYTEAYEAYQNAVYRDGRNPVFWCSIGILYFQINQPSDALDAYSRAIRLNSYIPQVWYNLGILYESCNNQMKDAMDAYTRAAELDPTNGAIVNKVKVLSAGGSSSGGGSDGQQGQGHLMPMELDNPEKYFKPPSAHPAPLSASTGVPGAVMQPPLSAGENPLSAGAYSNASQGSQGGSTGPANHQGQGSRIHVPGTSMMPLTMGRPPEQAGVSSEDVPGKKRQHAPGASSEEGEPKRPKQH